MKRESEVSDADEIAFLEDAGGDAFAVDPRSVVRPQILERCFAFEESDPRVMSTHQIAEQDDVIRRQPSERRDPFAQSEACPVMARAVNDDVGGDVLPLCQNVRIFPAIEVLV